MPVHVQEGTNTNVTQSVNLGVVGLIGASITDTGLTAGRVTYSGASGILTDSANLTYNGTTFKANQITDSGLTAGRVTYAGTAGLLVDSANFTYDGTNL
jgi:hypothetical protein